MSTSHQAGEVLCVRLTFWPGGSDNSQVASRHWNRDKLQLYTPLGVLTTLPTFFYTEQPNPNFPEITRLPLLPSGTTLAPMVSSSALCEGICSESYQDIYFWCNNSVKDFWCSWSIIIFALCVNQQVTSAFQYASTRFLSSWVGLGERQTVIDTRHTKKLSMYCNFPIFTGQEKSLSSIR